MNYLRCIHSTECFLVIELYKLRKYCQSQTIMIDTVELWTYSGRHSTSRGPVPLCSSLQLNIFNVCTVNIGPTIS